MLVAETDTGYRFITQPDHAALAGQFADHWGSDVVEAPEPPASVVMAAYRHDDGWAPYDRQPHLHDDGTPVDFTELPPDTWTALYAAGIDGVVELDRYAGLLVSMHGAGLRRRRYGLSPSWPETPEAFEGFVDSEEARQRRLADDLLDAGRLGPADGELLSTLHERGAPTDGRGSPLWRNYQRLQAWDVLSLAFCTTVDPPGYQDVGPVPTGDGAETTLRIEPLGGDAYGIEPYPFGVAPLAVSVPSRTVRAAAFDDEVGLGRAYYRAGRAVQTFTLRR